MTVIYNDACPICSREVDLYRREAEARGLDIAFAGLTRSDLAAYGLDPESAARRFHVLGADGRLVSGADAFFLLWRRLPRWAWLARLLDRRGLRPIARAVYDYAAAPALHAFHRRRMRRSRIRT